MASFYGSLLIDVFQGHAHEVNTYYFELGELSVVDVIVGADGGDYIHFVDGDNSGLTGTNIFINVTGVDRIYVDAASNIDIPNALVTSSNSTDPHDFTCHGSEDADVFNASAVTTTTHTLWLNGNGGDDVLYGGGGDGGLYEGGDGNDSIYVTEAVEEVNGEADDDTIRGSAAALDGDTLDGGSGDDELIFNTSGTVTLTLKNIETVTLGSAVNHVTLISEGHGQGDTFTAHVEGGSSADTVTVEDGSSILISDTYENFEIDGNGGNDILTGGDSDDTLNGGSDTDALSGGAGDDTLDGGSGNDIMAGGSGDDTYVNVGSGDLINELLSTGYDTIKTSVAVFGMAVNIEALVYTGFANANLTGNISANTITAGTGLDTVSGGDGDDILKGLGNADTLKGELGNDTLYGADGMDTMRGGAGDDTLFGGSSSDLLQGGDNNDTLQGGDAADTLEGGDGDDILIGGAGSDILNGGKGSDTVSYEGLATAVDVDLTRLAQEGISGGVTDDFISVENVTGGNAGDTIRGNSLGNVLLGGGGNDRLEGRLGDDTLDGGDNDDTLIGGQGDDILTGGGGFDTADYSADTEGIVVLKSGIQWSVSTHSLGHDETNDIDAYVGGSGSDLFFYVFNATGNDGDDEFYSTSSADTYDGGGGSDTVFYSDGLVADVLIVDLENPQFNTLRAAGDTYTGIENLNYSGIYWAYLSGDGNDNVITTDGEQCQVAGREGNDRVVANGIADIMTGDKGLDTLDYREATTGIGLDQEPIGVIHGTLGAEGDAATGFEIILGSAFEDTLTLISAGVDAAGFMLDGGDGDDIISSGDGDDTITGGAGADTIDGGEGIDTVSYSDAASGITLSLNSGNGHDGDAEGDSVSNVENIVGSGFDDDLTGDGGNNQLDGGSGADLMSGGNKQDTLNGGDGDDSFIVSGANHSKSGTSLRDIITDFAQTVGNRDVIDLSGLDAIESTGQDDAFAFIGDSGFDAAGQIRAVQLGADTLIHINTSGTSDAEMQILLLNFTATNLTEADFVL